MADDFYNMELADAEQRAHEHERHEHRAALHERDFDCHPDPRPLRRVPRLQAAVDATWREQVFERDQSSCCIHVNPAECEWPPSANHVVLAQMLRRDCHMAAISDRRIGMTVYSLAYRQHRSRVRLIRREKVPTEVVAFVYALGYGDWFERTIRRQERGEMG